jgi:glucokinase
MPCAALSRSPAGLDEAKRKHERPERHWREDARMDGPPSLIGVKSLPDAENDSNQSGARRIHNTRRRHATRRVTMIDHSRQALVGAIGGTYISLAVADVDELTVSHFALLNSADFDDPMQAIERYLKSIPRCPDKVGLALAGEVTGDQAQLTHRPWTITKNGVRAVTGADHVALINDFEALALSLPLLTDYDLNPVIRGEPVPYATKLVIFAGTGLGVAGLVHADDKWFPVRGEGGQVTFPAPLGDEFDVRQAFPSGAFVAAEDVFSGRGLVTLYNALAARKTSQNHTLSARRIAELGLSREDSIAAESLDLITTWLGRFAGDMALVYGARGGVNLAGGLAANIVPALTTGRFREAFESKGKLGAYLGKIPVNVIKTGADAGLRGATVALARSLPVRPSKLRRASSSA